MASTKELGKRLDALETKETTRKPSPSDTPDFFAFAKQN